MLTISDFVWLEPVAGDGNIFDCVAVISDVEFYATVFAVFFVFAIVFAVFIVVSGLGLDIISLAID